MLKNHRAPTPGRETRLFSSPRNKITIRKASDGSRHAVGYFCKWNVQSHDLGFREVLRKGCFSASLRENPVQCLFNHSPDQLLGRTESGTLQLQEDNIGLRFDVSLPNTTTGNDVAELLSRGDAFECSFAFSVNGSGGDRWSETPSGELQREVLSAVLYEGSILVSPAAYPQTEANLRSLPAALRSKLKKRDDDDDDDGDRPECDPDSPDFDEDECDEFRACSCTCSQCRSLRCDRCLMDSCTLRACGLNGCPAASETERLRLLLKVKQKRRRSFAEMTTDELLAYTRNKLNNN